jgi:hypothetical protein
MLNKQFFKIMYIKDKHLRFLLFAPLFFKDIVAEAVHEKNADLINSVKIADKFLSELIQKYDTDCKRFLKQVLNVNCTIRKCYKLYYNKQSRECQTIKIATAVVFAFYQLFYDICEHDGFNFYVDENNEYIITNKQYEFLKPYANIIKTNFIEPLATLGVSTLEHTTAQALSKGKKFNEDKFYKQCENNIETIINFLKNI